MYDARAIANYFLDRSRDRGIEITVMTLLKCLYFAHGWHLAKYGRPLVGQPFEAWRFGPVNRVVYDQLKNLGSRPVRQRLKVFDPETCGYREAKACLDAETSHFLDSIFDYYARFHAYRLSELTHEHGSPWDLIWREAETRAVPGMIIPDTLICDWFRGAGQRVRLAQ
jgi:uncharacterized phage-associated protein